MKAPKHLKHKPIIEVPDYENYEPFATDAMALSLGRSQYSDGNDFSAKVWRKPGKRWSRQSEELPFHRVLDLAVLVVNSLANANSGTVNKTNLKEEFVDNVQSNQIQDLNDYLVKNKPELDERINQLETLINNYKQQSKNP